MVTDKSKYPFLVEFFEEISAIPRMSYHEDRIADFICEFARKRGFEPYKDKANNVLVNIPPSEGYENAEAVMLQGHMDMVCEKDRGIEHDFLNDGIDLYEENGFLKAKGTTLGGDDGVAVIIMMALMDGKIPEHPECQCLFTTAEEVGLDGAKAFDYSRIFAKKVINIDNSDEESLIVGCAGGVRTDLVLDCEYEKCNLPKKLKISIDGLMGGHSGENIGEGRKNSNLLLSRLLMKLIGNFGVKVAEISGGSKDNAIPRNSEAVISTDDVEGVIAQCKDFENEVKGELVEVDRGFFVRCEEYVGDIASCFTDEFTRKVLGVALGVQNGVLKMSEDIEGLVEFSRNFAVISCEDKKLRLCYSSRSAKESQIEDSIKELEENGRAVGASVSHRGRYPGWDYSGHSELADRYIGAAKEICGLEVSKMTIHAGLECGLMKEAIPDLEIISCGPNCPDLHSPAERLEIASLDRVFEIISEMLK